MEKLEKYNVVRKICQASLGVVYLGQNKSCGDKVAIKVLPKNDALDNTKEIFIMRQLDHPNIIKFLEETRDQNYICLIFEYAENGDLFELLRTMKINRHRRLEEGMIRIVAHQIVSALNYCYSKCNIIHRDVKLENVFVTGLDQNIDYGHGCLNNPIEYEKIVCKLGDFGFATYEADKPNQICGTKEYLSPEMILGQVVDHKTDIWSLGVMLYECSCGNTPFDFCLRSLLESKIKSGEIDWTRLDGASKEFVNLIYNMLKTDPKQRIDYPDILTHPWLLMTNKDSHRKRRNTIQ